MSENQPNQPSYFESIAFAGIGDGITEALGLDEYAPFYELGSSVPDPGNKFDWVIVSDEMPDSAEPDDWTCSQGIPDVIMTGFTSDHLPMERPGSSLRSSCTGMRSQDHPNLSGYDPIGASMMPTTGLWTEQNKLDGDSNYFKSGTRGMMIRISSGGVVTPEKMVTSSLDLIYTAASNTGKPLSADAPEADLFGIAQDIEPLPEQPNRLRRPYRRSKFPLKSIAILET
ncbi:uncharacterized protein BDZ99DRAFT_521539 [Mytilinidion resinicola]|uniref:Uncharacterized protein n=1 Tax=Mytilinidion resinicola TaxID=574789 RepID=A0A6A6YM65_9PEZI|nr:uncharacterized protein BDZ99DRAFT_521539 [Mytilinidion resinicola]KAF2809074.1 hypothetical protein BDZ99DRAFT_521539 [Mytilinidion resinicola]